MSHFSVAIISKTPDEVEKLLAPYQENNMGDCPKEYLEFYSIEEEYLEKYQTDTVTKVKMPDGRLLYPWDDEFRVPGTIGYGSNTHKVPEGMGYEKIEIKFSELYPTFEEYMKDFCGYKERDPETGKYGYWENPNKKWDYWSERPRLKLKDGSHAATAKIKDIDFSPDPKQYEYAIRFWEINVEGQELKPDENKMDFFSIYKPEYYKEMYQSKEAYAEYKAKFKTWALITPDGKWHEQGSMGWWGFNDATKDSTEKFMDLFEKTIQETDPEFYLTIVDCHI